MTVLVRITATGMDQATYDQMAPELHPLLKKQTGFIMHVAYPIPGGFAVAEVWEGKAQQETWYNKFVTPNLPDPDAMSAEYFEIHAIGQPLDDHPENRNKPWLLAKHPANHQVSE